MAAPQLTDEERAEAEHRQKVLTDSYSKALATLRERHLDEFNQLRQIEARNMGVNWSPKPTPEQLAAAEIEAHLQAFPKLRDLFREETTDAPVAAAAD
jgi:hypothetical protein